MLMSPDLKSIIPAHMAMPKAGNLFMGKFREHVMAEQA